MSLELHTRSFKFRETDDERLEYVRTRFAPFIENPSQAVRRSLEYFVIQTKLHGPEYVVQGLLGSKSEHQLELFK